MSDHSVTYDFCQRRDGQVFAVREDCNGVTGAYGSLSEADIDALMNEYSANKDRYGLDTVLARLDYDANPAAAAWLRDNADKHQWDYSLHTPPVVPESHQQQREKGRTVVAHVLLAEDESAIREIHTLFLGLEGHQVTAPDDFWGVLAVLRSVLHPVVVVYRRDACVGQLMGDEERMTALEANLSALRRHRYVAVGWAPGPLPSRLAAIEDALEVEVLQQPVHLQVLADTVLRIAEQISA